MVNPRPIRVLAADPSFMQRESACALLARPGITVIPAADGLEAWELAQRYHPHALLTELSLPCLSGLELIRRCKALLPSLRVLVLTAAAGDWLTVASFAAGADLVLLKPVGWDETARLLFMLVGKLSRHLEALMLQHGAPPNRAGLRQSARCAELLAGQVCVQLKSAYIQVASEQNTSPACVSKNVERFVKEYAQVGDLSFLGFPPGSAPPANRDFLSALSRAATFPLESKGE